MSAAIVYSHVYRVCAARSAPLGRGGRRLAGAAGEVGP
jgi:hypothetical protein